VCDDAFKPSSSSSFSSSSLASTGLIESCREDIRMDCSRKTPMLFARVSLEEEVAGGPYRPAEGFSGASRSTGGGWSSWVDRKDTTLLSFLAIPQPERFRGASAVLLSLI
jgi:hypothetical protein